MAINNFVLDYPDDVDYITAYPNKLSPDAPGAPISPESIRLLQSGLTPGGSGARTKTPNSNNITEIARVPTRIGITISAVPIVSRYTISNRFSLAEYATGKLLQGSLRAGQGGGIW
jgi:hypothetical protein